MPAHATIGVHNYLAPRQTSIPMRTAHNKLTGGIDMKLGIFIQKLSRNNRLNHLGNDIFFYSGLFDRGGMLGTDHHSIHADWFSILIFHGNLRDLASGLK